MCIKKISNFCKYEILRELKAMKASAVVPIILINIIIPLLVYLQKDKITLIIILENIIKYNQIIIPIVSLYWTFMIVSNYYSGEGIEIFNVYGKNNISTIFVFQAVQEILILVSYFVLHMMVNVSYLECVRVLIISFLVNAMLYFVVTLTKNAELAFILIICFIIANIIAELTDVLKADNVFVFYKNSPFKIKDFWGKYVYYLIISIIMYVVSVLVKKKKI